MKDKANSKQDLIVFGEDWGALPSSTQHLIRHLKNHYRILWVNSIGLRQPRYTAADVKRAWKKFSQAFVGILGGRRSSVPVKSHYDMDTINLLTIPAPRTTLVRWLAGKLMAWQLKKAMKVRGMQRPILWSSLPTADDVIKQLDQQAIVYYCCDDFSSLQGVDHAVVTDHETRLVKQSDLVITTSETLSKKFSSNDTMEVSHGVDFKRFSTMSRIALDLEHIQSFFKFSAGFYGSIASWVDIESIAKAAENHPDWAFVFIGEICCDITPLKPFANCFFLGPRDHCELPRYSQHWDISMLPFRNTEQIRACNPLKLREYIAAGQPIYTTDFPALKHYRTQVNCGQSLSEFLDVYEKGRFTKPEPNSVSQESWQSRAREIHSALEKLA